MSRYLPVLSLLAGLTLALPAVAQTLAETRAEAIALANARASDLLSACRALAQLPWHNDPMEHPLPERAPSSPNACTAVEHADLMVKTTTTMFVALAVLVFVVGVRGLAMIGRGLLNWISPKRRLIH